MSMASSKCVPCEYPLKNGFTLQGFNSNGMTNGFVSHSISLKETTNGLIENDEITSNMEGLFGPAPFSDDPVAIMIRDKCDYSIKVTKEMALSGTAPRPVRVYADGVFDLFHAGHARQLMQAKNCFPKVYLIVGVDSDKTTFENKGKTIMNESERYEIVRHCRYVDEVICDCPWVTGPEFIEKHKIDFVAHDDLPYGMGDVNDVYKPLKDNGMFVATQRTEGVSTTDVVSRIVRNYDTYIRRNLARGHTARELNISFLKEKKIQLMDKIEEFKGEWGDKQNEFTQKLKNGGQNFVSHVLELFNQNGRLNDLPSENRCLTGQSVTLPSNLPDEEKMHKSNSLPSFEK